MVYTVRLNEDEEKQNLALVLCWLLLSNECDPPIVSNQIHYSQLVLFLSDLYQQGPKTLEVDQSLVLFRSRF